MFDRDGSGEISYEEFLRNVRGEMNQFRKNIQKECNTAFNFAENSPFPLKKDLYNKLYS